MTRPGNGPGDDGSPGSGRDRGTEPSSGNDEAVLTENGPATACVCARLRHASRAMTRIYDHHLEHAGLTLMQYSLLTRLSRVAPPTMRALSILMGLDRSSLTRTLEPLKERGWLDVEPGQDRRRRIVRLTDAGRQARLAAEPLWQAAQEDVRRRLGTAETMQMIAMLERAADRLDQAVPPGIGPEGG
ncbi:MAG: winged helix-turn-helix transcriptional regulator [Telmatospirillum sp.]|nr:winged helix-turn-helix transcriptional regulator [Telmatospirillum sp.]